MKKLNALEKSIAYDYVSFINNIEGYAFNNEEINESYEQLVYSLTNHEIDFLNQCIVRLHEEITSTNNNEDLKKANNLIALLSMYN